MASKIQSHNFYVAIAGYQLPSVPDQTFNCLRVSVGYRKGSGFYASFHPGWGDGSMWGCMFDFSKDPLSAGMTVDVEPATKNSAKRIAEMTESLKMAKDIIAALFDDREWQKLNGVLQNVAKFGYTEKFKEQGEAYLAARVSKRCEKAVKPIESETNNENNIQNSTTMAQNVKAADLIGKTIVVGDNQGTIVIKSVQDNGMLACEFKKTDSDAITPMTVTMPNLQKMTERGLWKINLTPNPSPKGEGNLKGEGSEVTTEADVAEVDDIVPVVTKKEETHPQPLPVKGGESEKPKAKVEPIGKKSEGRGKKEEKPQPSAVSPQTSKYVYATYQTSKGKTGAKITGFASENDVFYAMAADIHASGSYERDKQGNKHYYLCFGPRYAEAAKSICKVLNSDKTINAKVEECKLIVSQATEDLATKREEWKQKREERKAKKNLTPNPSPKGEGSYSDKDVAEMLRKIMAGGDVPEDIKTLLAKAA